MTAYDVSPSGTDRPAACSALGDVRFGAVLADHGTAGDGPAGHAVGDVDGVHAATGQGLSGVGRPGAAAADHVDLTVAGQFAHARPEVAEAHVHGLRCVACGPLVVFAHIQQEYPGREVGRQDFRHGNGLVHVGLLG